MAADLAQPFEKYGAFQNPPCSRICRSEQPNAFEPELLVPSWLLRVTGEPTQRDSARACHPMAVPARWLAVAKPARHCRAGQRLDPLPLGSEPE